ncbi:MAG: hypothetical protein U0Z26_04530 [Anaerolineales bacterium]
MNYEKLEEESKYSKEDSRHKHDPSSMACTPNSELMKQWMISDDIEK